MEESSVSLFWRLTFKVQVLGMLGFSEGCEEESAPHLIFGFLGLQTQCPSPHISSCIEHVSLLFFPFSEDMWSLRYGAHTNITSQLITASSVPYFLISAGDRTSTWKFRVVINRIYLNQSQWNISSDWHIMAPQLTVLVFVKFHKAPSCQHLRLKNKN